MTRRVLITGSRTWLDYHTIATEITRYLVENATLKVDSQGLPANIEDWVIVHGACPTGADALAMNYAITNWIEQEPHPADWGRSGKHAGLLRNEEMVLAGADVCLAFINRCNKKGCKGKYPHGSHGATHCASLAEAAGIEVRRFPPE